MVRMFVAMISMAIASCTYDATFGDCAISCSAASGCPSDLLCGSDGLCRAPGITESCAVLGDAGLDAPVQSGSCDGIAATCGPSASESCCATATTIPGGTFYRSYDLGTDGLYSNMSYPATVSSFRLDKYEVTVGRFRMFVAAGKGTQVAPPAAGAGARILNGMATQGGWDTGWNSSLSADTATLKINVACDATYQSWTDAPGMNENLPMNCITWFDAMAFCAWDGGHLPTEAEWNFAASGGSEQRAYPWSTPASSTTIDCAHANYATCASSGPRGDGSGGPGGDGRWGHADLAGNVWEWTLDWAANYQSPCSDCANLIPETGRILRGGSFRYDVTYSRSSIQKALIPTNRFADVGLRCARN